MYSPLISSDRQRIMQVLLGLQSNAIKFTQKGKVEISVKIVQEQGDERFLQVSVIDTGIGIPLEDQDKLFKLFGFVQSTA
jgi:signal transduction histidine kinase